jgi:integrase
MSISVFCSKCIGPFSLTYKNCPNCGKELRNEKKFWVNLPLPNGSRKTKVVEGNLTTARNVEAKIKSDIKQEKYFGIKKAPLINDVWEKFQKWNKKNIKDSATVSSRWYVHIKPRISETMRMNQLTPLYISNKILDRMRETGGRNGDGCADATIKHALGVIKRLYSWAREMELYDGDNPATKIKPPKLNNQVIEYLRKAELRRLLDVLEHWPNQSAALVVKFALYTGCRKGDIFKLQWKDVDFAHKFIYLRDPKGKRVQLPIGLNTAFDVLLEARKLNAKSKWVFANQEGEQRKHFAATWARIKKKARLRKEFRFHDLRHTFATYLASSGKVDLFQLQKLLNHQSPTMTQRYAHLLDGALRRAANVVDDVF